MMPGSWGRKLEECCKEQGRLAEASEEGLGSNRAVAPMMMMMMIIIIPYIGSTWWRSWFRHCATRREVAGSIPDGVI